MATKRTNVVRGVTAAIVLVLMGQQAVAAELARALYVPPPPLCPPRAAIWLLAEPSPWQIRPRALGVITADSGYLKYSAYPAYFYETSAGGHRYGKGNPERAAFIALGNSAIGWQADG
ncbi:hypothetical protein [Mesorhizobium sp. M1216]|uniref:hypothetical protein n=1 Tax=Mesorhizobium sp. M1216 TaxID=2957069 RepID=UPI00333A50F4